jgi:hypothetical protein
MQFDLLKPNGGVWMVPRSGLIFTRKGDELHLSGRMPFTEDMKASLNSDIPHNTEDLLAFQKQDFDVIASHFKAAGINVINSVD